MVDTPLEIECSNCSESYWYEGPKSFPDAVECPECGKRNTVPEDA